LGYDEPEIPSYAISPFCPISADGLHLNFITAIHHRLGIDVPELDYPKLITLSGAMKYLETKIKSGKG
jgi:hypothetical protein